MPEIVLLPYKFRPAGTILILAGLVLATLYIWFDFRVTLPVFAAVSAFYETKFFTMIHTNVADEFVLLSLLSGLALIAFTREKIEPAGIDLLRLRALFRSSVLNTLLLLAAIVLVFGGGFLGLLVFNLFSFLLFYVIFFRVSLFRLRRGTQKRQPDSEQAVPIP
ncbi:MAG: hypothetical protein JNL22_13875 [Bacteroidales bacterium]|jgi:hypothetical protein|nr:hypothetical protein [Bacteroidales bacterium]